MGLEDADLVDDGYVGGKSAVSVSCSICLEVVTDNGDRSWAKLQCGHEFHLDCIGSAFNVKGVMQCPNCRKIEKGQWLYANGCRPYPEFSVDEWDHDVDLYDLSYPETSMWCPFGGFTRLTASFDDGEFPTTAYHDLVGQHAIFTEHASASATHLCPYITYVQPLHPSSSSSSASTATATVGDGPTSYNNNQWNNSSSQSDQMPNSYALDVRYHTLFPTSTNRPDQPQPPRRPLRNNTSYVHPFLVGQSSGGRAPGSSMIHPYPGSAARARERSQALQAYFQQPTGLRAPPMVPGSRRSTGQAQTQAQMGQVGPSSDQICGGGGIYYLPTSSGRSGPGPAFQEPAPWERDSHPGVGWGFHPGQGQGQGGSMFRQRHGSERNSSHGHYRS